MIGTLTLKSILIQRSKQDECRAGLTLVTDGHTISVHLDLFAFDGIFAFLKGVIITNRKFYHFECLLVTNLALEAIRMPFCIQCDSGWAINDLLAGFAFVGNVGVETLLANRPTLAFHIALPNEFLLAEVADKVLLMPFLAHTFDDLLADHLVTTMTFG